MSVSKFTIEEIVRHIQKLGSNGSEATPKQKTKCLLKELLDKHKIPYSQGSKNEFGYVLKLSNDAKLAINSETGEHRYAIGGNSYYNKRLTTQGWTDFLCLKRLIPAKHASQTIKQSIEKTDKLADAVSDFLDKKSVAHTVDPVTKFIFLGDGVNINCQKGTISYEDEIIHVDLGNIEEAFNRLMRHEG